MKKAEIPRWDIVRELGHGGQAHVYLVSDNDGILPGRFAMKVLAPDRPTQAYQRFINEIESTKKVDHEYVTKIVDSSAPDAPVHFYVMEYIENAITLKKLLGTPNNLFFQNPHKSICFFEQLLSAIIAWNNQNIVHRDLSPGNILVVPDGTIRVIDFGICQSDDGQPVTLLDEGVGTQNYMAPECESGANSTVSIFADVYSAAKLLWAAATNRKAFARETPVFRDLSMRELFPHNKAMWNLQEIFDRTIRQNVNDRIAMIDLMNYTARLSDTIGRGFPHAEDLQHNCPYCGLGILSYFDGARQVFGNHLPNGYSAVECDNCGHCMVINRLAISKKRENRNNLS